MYKIILFLVILFSACIVSENNFISAEDQLYTKAFCMLMHEKHAFDTPNNISKDTLLILDHYYVDTSSIYYNTFNLGFELSFVDPVSTANNKPTEEKWNAFKRFSDLMERTYKHNINSECLDTMKIKFVSMNDVIDTKKEYRTFMYSPLIKHSSNLYAIYEHKILNPGGFFYSYVFKRVGDNFEFVKRSYHSDPVYTDQDYMKTVNFKQTYKEFVDCRQ